MSSAPAAVARVAIRLLRCFLSLGEEEEEEKERATIGCLVHGRQLLDAEGKHERSELAGTFPLLVGTTKTPLAAVVRAAIVWFFSSLTLLGAREQKWGKTSIIIADSPIS